MSIKRSPVIQAEDLRVQFRTSSGRRLQALDGLNLTVDEGQVVGFVGPNGAGKTTTIKILMGFLKPTEGTARVFGGTAGTVASKRRTGYLPEVALYYPFLNAEEALGLYAKLAGISPKERRDLVPRLIRRVGLAGREKERLSGFSKGMLQRIGIAQAIMGEPDLLVLDEVTSGLDPVARHDVRGILMEFKAKGKTVFFSSHELSEVTMLCDRIILIDEGKVIEESPVSSLLASLETTVIKARAAALGQPLPSGVVLQMAGDGVNTYHAEGVKAADDLRGVLRQAGVEILEIRQKPPSLEDYFVRKLGHKVT